MPRPVVILAILLLLAGGLAGLVLANPLLVVRPVLQAQLAQAGFQLRELESAQLRSSSAHFSAVTAESDTLLVSVDELTVNYSLGQLINGQLEAVRIGSLNARLKENARADNSNESEGIQLNALFTELGALPVTAIEISALHLTMPQGDISGELAFQTSPLTLLLSGQYSGEETLQFELHSERAAHNQLEVSSTVSQDNVLLVEGAHDLELLDTGLTATGELAIAANSLVARLMESNMVDLALSGVDWAILNEQLLLGYQLELNTAASSPAIQSLQATIDSSAPNLQLQVETDSTRLLAQLSMPMTLSASPNSASDWFGIRLSDSSQNLSWYREDDEFHIETSISDLNTNCESLDRCVTRGQFQLTSPAWQVAGISGQQASANGELIVEKLPASLEFRSEDLVINMPLVQFDQYQGDATFEVEQLFLILGNLDRGRLKLHSSNLNLASDSFTLLNPALAATVNFSGDKLAGSADVSLGLEGSLEQPLLQGSFNHDLANSTGQAELTLHETTFSEAQALSSFLAQDQFDIDVVAGTVSGSSEPSWQLDEEEFRVAGPVSLHLNALGGHVEDTLIVGLSSHVRGEFEDWSAITSAPDLTATIDVVDIGLPAHNVQWQYRFDTAQRTLFVEELNTELFGGKIEVADFRLSQDEPDQELTLVLSRLNLESIVNLAGYPQLFVDGLISGYVPLSLKSGQILIEDGLVGALRPGGNIRYTPGSESAAVNQTMQLVNDALSNYQYETLDTRVFYDENGDLRMEVQLQGINPDMNGGQPINLNVNITDNIPSLLRSLKAGQEISDRLEQHLQIR